MENEVVVYVDLHSAPQLVGRLWMRSRKDRESATFEYDPNWLAHPNRFSLEPALKLGPGPFHTASDQPLFGAIGDSAPDGWGMCSCAAPNVAELSAKARHRAPCGKSTTC